MKEKSLQNNLLMALGNHKDLVLDMGDDVILYPIWNEQEQIYEDEMGKTGMELLIQIANGEIYVHSFKTKKMIQVKLYVKE